MASVDQPTATYSATPRALLTLEHAALRMDGVETHQLTAELAALPAATTVLILLLLLLHLLLPLRPMPPSPETTVAAERTLLAPPATLRVLTAAAAPLMGMSTLASFTNDQLIHV
jgi:hypothetical protein